VRFSRGWVSATGGTGFRLLQLEQPATATVDVSSTAQQNGGAQPSVAKPSAGAVGGDAPAAAAGQLQNRDEGEVLLRSLRLAGRHAAAVGEPGQALPPALELELELGPPPAALADALVEAQSSWSPPVVVDQGDLPWPALSQQFTRAPSPVARLELDLPAGPAPPDPAATAPAGAGRLQQRGESSPDSPSWVDVDGPATWPSLKGASQSLAAVTAAAAALVQSGSSSGSTSHGR
jgi:hypothetical protein